MGLEHVEFATLDYVSWFNTERILGPIGWVSPAEYEEQYHREETQAMGA